MPQAMDDLFARALDAADAYGLGLDEQPDREAEEEQRRTDPDCPLGKACAEVPSDDDRQGCCCCGLEGSAHGLCSVSRNTHRAAMSLM